MVTRQQVHLVQAQHLGQASVLLFPERACQVSAAQSQSVHPLHGALVLIRIWTRAQQKAQCFATSTCLQSTLHECSGFNICSLQVQSESDPTDSDAAGSEEQMARENVGAPEVGWSKVKEGVLL